MTNLELLNYYNRHNRLQPYKTWKGTNSTTTTTTSVVATNSHPLIVNNNNFGPKFINQRNAISSKYNAKGTANPIKHWRKQLIVNPGSGHGKVSVNQVMDRPGGSIHLVNQDIKLENPCPNTIKNYIVNTNTKASPNLCTKTLCNKERITRSASTIVKKNYYTTNGEYLRNRYKLYNQNQTISPLSNNKSTLVSPPPSNSDTGSQVYNSTSCYDNSFCDTKHVSVIYKPNNPNFSQQGAVSSGLRMDKLKYDTIQKSAKNLEDPWGPEAANAAKYRGNMEAAYFNKSKFDLPASKGECLTNRKISGRKLSGGTGEHTVCFRTTGPENRSHHKLGSLLDHVKGPGTGILIASRNPKTSKYQANAFIIR